MTTGWVVVLEMAKPAHLDAIDLDSIKQALIEVADAQPAVLVAADRYAMQLNVVADGPAEALLVALARCRDVTGRLCIPPWDLVRADVQTRAEFEHECNDPALSRLLHFDGLSPANEAEDERFFHISFRDSLTGLASAGLFTECVQRALNSGAASGRVHGLLLVELDGFGAIGRRIGPSGADSLLVEVAARLRETLREGDVIARLEGARFGVLIRNIRSSSAPSTAGRVIARVRSPVVRDDGNVSPTASVGIAVGHAGQTGAELIREAAGALAIAKRTGGDRSVVFTARAPASAVAEIKAGGLTGDPVAGAYLDLLGKVTAVTSRPRPDSDSPGEPGEASSSQVGLSRGRLWKLSRAGEVKVVSAWRSPTLDAQAPACGCERGEVNAAEAALVMRALESGTPVWEVDGGGDEVHLNRLCPPLAAMAVPVVAGTEAVAVLHFVADPEKPGEALVSTLNAVGAELEAERRRGRPAAL